MRPEAYAAISQLLSQMTALASGSQGDFEAARAAIRDKSEEVMALSRFGSLPSLESPKTFHDKSGRMYVF